MKTQTKMCRHCKEEFTPFFGKPGKIDECLSCAIDIPHVIAGDSPDESGTGWSVLPGKVEVHVVSPSLVLK